MATAKFTLEAEEAKAVQAFLQVRDAQQRVTDGTKQMTREGKMATDSHVTGFKNVVTQLVSVAAAVGVAKAAYASWKAEQAEVAAGAIKLGKTLTEVVSGRGDLANLTKIREYVEKNATGGLGMQEASQVYESVGGAMPAADFETMFPVFKKALEARLAGDKPVEFGQTMGEFAGLFVDKSLDDLADMTKVTRELLGRYGGTFNEAGLKVIKRFAASDLGGAEEGLALVLSSFYAGQGAEGATGIIQKLTEDKAVKGKGAVQLQQKAFYGAGPTERMEMLRDPAMVKAVFESQATAIQPVIDRYFAGELQTVIKKAQVENIFEQSKELVGKDRLAKQTVGIDKAVAVGERVKHESLADDAVRDEQVTAVMDAIMAKQGRSKFTRDFGKMVYQAYRYVGADYDVAASIGYGMGPKGVLELDKYLKHPEKMQELLGPETKELIEAVKELNHTMKQMPGKLDAQGGRGGRPSMNLDANI